MRRAGLLALLLALAPVSAWAQTGARLVPSCGSVTYGPGDFAAQTVTPDGRLCIGSAPPSATPAGGLSVYRVMSGSSAAAAAVKSSAGRLYSFNLCNNAAATRYVRFYDSPAAVTGTTPVAAGAIALSAGSCQQFTTSFGLAFTAGISMSVTAANGDADTTAPAAGDVSGFLGYQ
jgi:hypothetical protein